MPYHLEQSGSGYYVVGPSGRHSQRPLPRRRAAAQMRALYAAETKDAGTTAGAPLSGPGGLLGVAGLGGRRWGNRRKDTACTCGIATKEQLAPGVIRIRGNLCNVHGRYGPCDAAQSGKRKPKKGAAGRKPPKPKQTPEQRAAARQAEHAANRGKVLTALGIDAAGQAALTALREGKQPDAQALAALARMGAIDAGIVEEAADGSYRLTASGRATLNAADQGDQGRAGDTISGARDRLGARRTRQEAAAQRKRDAEAKRAAAAAAKKKQPKAGGGKKPTPGADREAERQQREAERQSDRKRREREHDEDRARRLREHEEDRAARQRGDMNADLDRRERQRAAPGSTSIERTPTHTTRVDKPKRKPGPRKRQTTKGYTPTVKAFTPLSTNRVRGWISAHEAIARWEESTQQWVAPQRSFAVFKSADGSYRWVMRTTTAYRDRDGEIITTKALERDAQRMTATGQYGPLRYWHMGQPDPFNVTAPWGPGIDIGDCDYSIVIDRTSIESGTFKSAAIGRAFAASAGDYESSPGFFHPPNQPNAAGEYNEIRRFERSTVPVQFGRASNLFTGMAVKEFRMDQETYEQRVKAFIADMGAKGVPPEVTAATIGQMQQADKSAQQQGIAYKSDERVAGLHLGAATEIPDAPVDPWQAVVAALKSALGVPEQVEEKAMAPASMEQAGETEIDDGLEEQADEGDPMADDAGGEYIGDMTPAEFWTQLQEYLAPVLKMQEMHKALSDMVGELKGMGAAYATKDAGTTARLAQLEATIAQLAGDVPAVVENEALAALKSSGPQAPEANALPVPTGPVQAAAMQTFPQLYQTNPQNGQWAGWQSQALPPPSQS
jgi:hypothetical protein